MNGLSRQFHTQRKAFDALMFRRKEKKRQAATYFGDSTNNNSCFHLFSHLQLPSLRKWLSVTIMYKYVCIYIYIFFCAPRDLTPTKPFYLSAIITVIIVLLNAFLMLFDLCL